MYFALVGLLGGVIATVFLFFYVPSQFQGVVLGLKHPWSLVAFPLAGAILAALYTTSFGPQNVGPAVGTVIALAAFITFCALVAIVGEAGLWGFLAFAFFGFISFGWGSLLLGGIAGWYFRRSVRRAL